MIKRMARYLLHRSPSNHRRLRGSAKPFPLFHPEPLPYSFSRLNPNFLTSANINFPRYTHPVSSTHSSQLGNCGIGVRRGFCSGSTDYSAEVDEINLKFAEAREEIDAALDSKETVYFDEEAECAREAVKVVLDMFEGLLARLPENDRAALQRSMGLKIHQLKAELEQLNE